MSPTPTTKGSAAQAFGFRPFTYTNRPVGPLVGARLPMKHVGPSQTQKDIGTAKMAANIALTATRAAIQAAVALGVNVAQAAVSWIPVVGAAVGVGFAGAQGAAAKTDEQRDRALQQGSIALVGLLPGLGLAALPMAIEGINDAAQRKERAKATVKEYVTAQKDIQGSLAPYVKASDRLDELILLPRVSTAQQIAWCRDSLKVANDGLLIHGARLSPALDIIGNGQDMIGIPGRDVSNLRVLVGNASRDAFILFFACRDILVRSRQSAGDVWPDVGRNGTLRALRGEAGVTQASSLGVIPGVTGFDDPQGNGWADQIAPALVEILDVISASRGWGLWGIVQYFDSLPDVPFRGSSFHARVVASRALETVFTVTPHEDRDVPTIPSRAAVMASLDQTRASLNAILMRQAGEEEARAQAWYAEQLNVSVGGM